MIVAKFFYSKNNLCLGFSIKGHANSGKYGRDLVCCAVSAIVQMCCNGLTDIAKALVKIYSKSGFIRVWVNSSKIEVQVLLKSLELEVNLISLNYKDNLKLIRIEV